jgi:hypothetical protein
MDSLPPLRSSFLERQDIGSGDLCITQGKYVLDRKFDFDVYLPTRGMNLQRPLVWTIAQKRALIESVIIRRSIPPISVVYTLDDIYQVIDGKQRLSAFIEYVQDGFDFCGYHFSELPPDYKGQINRHFICAYQLCEYHEEPISDDDKIEWFNWINFAGTPQDEKHMQRLRSANAKPNHE